MPFAFLLIFSCFLLPETQARNLFTSPTLTNLLLDNGSLSPAFSPSVTSYQVNVPGYITAISITPVSNDNTTTITVNSKAVAHGTSQSVPLNTGDNTITINITAADGTTANTYTLTVTRQPSTIARLSFLGLTRCTLSPAFDPGTNNYTATIADNTITSVSLTAIAVDATSTIKVNGVTLASGTASAPIPVNNGTTTITTAVTAQDGATVDVYTITITKAISTNASLSNLILSNGGITPAFFQTITSYTAIFGNTVTSVTVTPVVADSTATVNVNGIAIASGATTAPIALNLGTNVITVTVTAQDGVTVKTYTITVNRVPSGNSKLSFFGGSHVVLSPAFDIATANYTSSVPNSLTSTVVTPVAVDPAATVRVNGKLIPPGTSTALLMLSAGPNVITAVVTAQDSTTSTYTMVITRAPSTNASLAGLSLNNGTLSPAFTSTITSYSASVADTSASVGLTPFLADSTATLTLNGSPVITGKAVTLPLKVGSNVMTIVVTAQDGTTINTYTVTINRTTAAAVLASLSISKSGLSPAFSADGTTYSATIPTAKKDHTIFTIGDSITANNEYQTHLDSLLQGSFKIVNFGTSGNVTINMVNRFPLVLNESPDYVIILAGIVDLESGYTANTIETNLQNLYNMAHNAGIKVVALITTPFKNQINWSPAKQTVQDAVNAWIPTAKNIDFLINANAAIGDPANPQQLLPVYDSGDHLHPSKAGEDKIASAIFAGVTFVPSAAKDILNADTSITLKPVTNNPKAIVTINGMVVQSGSSSAKIPLSLGPNIISTVVTLPDSNFSRTYTATVTRAPSGNTNLAGLLGGRYPLSPLFDPSLSHFSTSVINEITSLKIIASRSDANATVTLNNGPPSAFIPLNVGVNNVIAKVVAQDGSVRTDTLAVFRALSPNARLSYLGLSHCTLSPVFNVATNAYTATIADNTISSVAVTAIVVDSTAAITVNGTAVKSGKASAPITIGPGQTIITTAVTAQDGTTVNTYTTTVTRLQSNNANLASLGLSNNTLAPAFSQAATNYTASVNNTVSSVILTPVAADTASRITVNGIAVAAGTATAPITLNIGSNTITTIVTAQDGITKKTYTLTLTRIPSTNARLSYIGARGCVLSPAFVSATNSYTSTVANSVTSTAISPIVVDGTATVKVNGVAVASGSTSGNITLNPGINNITILVTAQDGSTNTYTLAVSRTATGNPNLARLSLSNSVLSPAFSQTTTSYSASVNNTVTSTSVTPAAADTTARITVNGTAVASGKASAPINLNLGSNTIQVLVTAQDGVTIKNYAITVTRVPSANSKLGSLSLSHCALSPVFVNTVNNYTSTVANTITSTTVSPILVDATASVTVNGAAVPSGGTSAIIPLNVGSNTVTTVVTAQNGSINTYTIVVTRMPSANAGLAGLSLSSGLLSPVFATATTAYTAVVGNPLTTTNITPVTADQTATIKVNGATVTSGTSQAITLSVGANIISTVVTAQDGSTKTYTINLTRQPATNAHLSYLGLTHCVLSPAYASATTSYTSTVANSVTSTSVQPISVDANATIKVNGTAVSSDAFSPPFVLNPGNNVINTAVTAQDGSTIIIYTVNVYRTPLPNTNLAGLTVANCTLSPAFAQATTGYTATVANSVVSTTITATTADNFSTVTVNGVSATSGTASSSIPLSVGQNVLTTVVKAIDGTTKTYTVTVTRAASSNSNLSKMVLNYGALSPVFAQAVTTYNVAFGNPVTAVTLTPTVADPTATVAVNGSLVTSGTASPAISLHVGVNSIVTTVTAQDGSVKTYTVNATRQPSSNAKLSFLGLSHAVLSPSFANTTTSYTASVPYTLTSTNVLPIEVDTTARTMINGVAVASGLSTPVSLNIGNTVINAIVTAQDGTTQITYTITVTRAGPPGMALNTDRTDSVTNVSDGILVHQAISPNGDGINDVFIIEGLDAYPENKVMIMNRNGNLVFETKGYNNSSKVFDGHSNKTGTMQLPGTYFYILEYTVGNNIKRKTGYLVMKY